MRPTPPRRSTTSTARTVVVSLAEKPGNLGFILPDIAKNDLFRGVVFDGVLPRKTFSMGEAHEKRYYMEAKTIVK